MNTNLDLVIGMLEDQRNYEAASIVRQLAEQRAELLGALQEMVEFFQPNACGSEDNRRDALNGAFRIINKIEAKP